MQSENIINGSNALQAYRGPMREPMAQLNFGLEEDIYSTQVDQFLGKNAVYDNMVKPHNAFMDQIEMPMGLQDHNEKPAAAPQGDYSKSHQLHVIPSYTQKENDSNLAPVFRQCEPFTERQDYG